MLLEKAIVLKNEELSEGVFSTVFSSRIAENCRPGQFVMVGTKSEAHLLKRPISICGADNMDKTIRLVYRIAGFGTRELSESKEGDEFELQGPAGNGFLEAFHRLIEDKNDAFDGYDGKRFLLIGGGIGAPPLLFLCQELKSKGISKDRISAVLGYRGEKNGLFLIKEFEEKSELILSTDDGSAGYRGTVMDAIRESGVEADIIFACGPLIMLKAVREYAKAKGIPAFISLEERMACGVGACLPRVVKTR